MVLWAALPSSFKGALHPSFDNDGVSDLPTECRHHAVMVSREHCCGSTFYRPDALPVA